MVRLLIAFLLIGTVAQAQNFPPIYGKINYRDSLQMYRYKNNLAGDSVLSTDTSGKVRLVLKGSGGGGTTTVSDSAWMKTGNLGTDPTINGIGTNDSADLVIKTYNTERARFLSTGGINIPATVDSTTGVIFKGSDRFIHNFSLPGTSTSFFGKSLYIGRKSGNFTMTGSVGGYGGRNTAVGDSTLFANTTGYRNTAIGIWAGAANTSGFENTVVGGNAFEKNTTAWQNTAIGAISLQYNTTGQGNTAVGVSSLQFNITGERNTAIGVRAMTNSSTSFANVAVGLDALSYNTTADHNVGVGLDALYYSNGTHNVAVGDSTLWGLYALGTKHMGYKNIALGSRAGYHHGDTYPNFASIFDTAVIFLGANASRDSSIPYTTSLQNMIVIGYNARGFASNLVVLGNEDITTTVLRGNIGIGTTAPATQLHTTGTVRHAGVPTTVQARVAMFDATGNLYSADTTGLFGSGGGSMVYPPAGIAVSTGSAWGTSITDNSTNWNTAYSQTRQWDGGSTGLVAGTGRTSLGGTTIGQNIFTLTNPGAITFLRMDAANTATARSAADFKTDLSLNNVENTALSTWAGTTNVTTLGTIGAGTWQGSVIGSTYGGTGVNNAGRTLTINTNSGTVDFTAAAKTLTVPDNASVSGTNTGDQTTISGNAGTATTLQTTRTLWGQNFNGSANVTGDITLGASNLTMTGSLAATGARVTKGWFTDIESTNTPTVGGVALPTASSTTTFTNKRWTARVGSTTSSATPTINTDNTDVYKLTAQTADITSFTTNLSGTPNDGDILEIQITGTAARAIAWGASFVSSTVTLPATTVTTATLTVVLQYFTTSSYGANKWVCVNSF